MAISNQTRRYLEVALTNKGAAKEIVTALNSGAGASSPSSPVVPVAITYTASASAYAADGTLTIANGSTPTVAELLDFCIELRANIVSLQAVLHSHGLTS